MPLHHTPSSSPILNGELVSSSSSEVGTSVAVGAFDVKVNAPEMIAVPEGASAIGRHLLEKTYHGALQGRSVGEMLSAGQPRSGEASYVAIESFSGTLDGRTGGFALAHLGTMHAGGESLQVTVVPGSGSGELTGITGELVIRRENGKHDYTLNYRLP
jgi:hypothetical protein